MICQSQVLPTRSKPDPSTCSSWTLSTRHHAPAIGFVIERRVQEVGRSQGTELLDQWVRRGYELGNHTLSHAEMNDLTVEQIEQEIIGGEGAFVAALAHVGKPPVISGFQETIRETPRKSMMP